MLCEAAATLKGDIAVMEKALRIEEYGTLQKVAYSIEGTLLNMGLKQHSEKTAKNCAYNKKNCDCLLVDMHSFIMDVQGDSWS